MHEPTGADVVPLTQIMVRPVTTRGELAAEQVVELMIGNKIGCLPVVDERGRPRGMITKLDLVEHRGESCCAEQLMMPTALSVSEHATVAHAAALMANEDLHHLLVVDLKGVLIGVVSSMDIIRWLARNDGLAS